MGYSTTYWLDCDQDAESYSAQCCSPTEFGRVRSVAFIRKRYLQQILLYPTDLATWQAGINGGDIVVIPFTSGTFDAGKPQKLKGYGRRLSTHGFREMTLNFSLPFEKVNFSFFASLDKHTDYAPAFRTSSNMHICDRPADISTTELVGEDMEEGLSWSVECVVRTRTLPAVADANNILPLFTCDTSTIPPVASTVLRSDYWLIPTGATELGGASVEKNYQTSNITDMLLVAIEGTQYDVITSGIPGNRQIKWDSVTKKFSWQDPALAGQRLNALFKL